MHLRLHCSPALSILLQEPRSSGSHKIDSVDQNPAPKRIVLGSDSYTAIQKALMERLAAGEAQRDLAFSTDFPAGF